MYYQKKIFSMVLMSGVIGFACYGMYSENTTETDESQKLLQRIHALATRLAVKEDEEEVRRSEFRRICAMRKDTPAISHKFTTSDKYTYTVEQARKQIQAAKQSLEASMDMYHPMENERFDAYAEYGDDVYSAVLKTPSMTNEEKLYYLYSYGRYDHYEMKKKIVMSMLNETDINLNHVNFTDTNPLLESIDHEDPEFASLLLKRGLRIIRPYILEKAARSLSVEIKELFLPYQTDSSVLEHKGVFYKKNNFGDVFPFWEDIAPEHLSQKLLEFTLFMQTMPGTPCLIDVPRSKAAALDAIKQANFTLYHADNEKTEWMYSNGSSIPAPYTAIIGAQVLVKKNDTVLVIEEKTRKGLLGFPAGTAELQELPCQTAQRELKEEVNLSVETNKLQLFATINRTRANRFKANSVNHYFTINYDDVCGEPEPDHKEVLRVFYAPLQDIAEQKTIDGLTVSPAVAALAKHLQEGRNHSFSQSFVDYRQLSKKEECRDQNDIMTIEFFGK